MWFRKESVIASEQRKNLAYLKSYSPDGKNHANTKIFETPPSNKKLKKGIPANMSDYIFLPAMGNYTNGKFNSFRTYGFYWLKTPYPYDSEIAFNLFFKENEADLSNMSNRSNRYKLWTSE